MTQNNMLPEECVQFTLRLANWCGPCSGELMERFVREAQDVLGVRVGEDEPTEVLEDA